MEMEAGVSGPKKKRSAPPRVDEDGGGVDSISNLPDAVLGDIISLLPTKDGARTQILAPRWRHLWRSAPLNLDCGQLGYGEVASVLPLIISSHQGPGRRFCLPTFSFCKKDDRAAVEACLQSPALDNLQDLQLDLGSFKFGGQLDHFGQLRKKPVPASFFRFSSTLVSFQIGHCRLSDVTVQELQFPLLKHLGLRSVEISECSLHNMIGGCPALECLMVYCCHGASCLRINSLCLRRIAVTHTRTQRGLVLQELIIENAPRLETLLLLNDIQVLHVSILFAPKLETLGCTTSRVVFGSKDIQGPHINSFATIPCTIKCLALITTSLSLDLVINVMGYFPCLEKLYIQCETSGKKNVWRRKHRDLIKSLDLHLKKLVLNYYRGRKSDADFVSFFLLNARVLESITLVVQDDRQDLSAKRRLKLLLENRTLSGAPFHFTTLRRRRNLWQIDKVCDMALIDPFE